MASSKVIFFLHCTVFAQLFSYAIVGAYNFRMCNHTAIVTMYDNVLKNHFPPELKVRSVNNRCNWKPSERCKNFVLGCIHSFTQKHSRNANLMRLWKDTAATLNRFCKGYSENNGSQNKSVSSQRPQSCIIQRKKVKILNEVYRMWMKYKRCF